MRPPLFFFVVFAVAEPQNLNNDNDNSRSLSESRLGSMRKKLNETFSRPATTSKSFPKAISPKKYPKARFFAKPAEKAQFFGPKVPHFSEVEVLSERDFAHKLVFGFKRGPEIFVF